MKIFGFEFNRIKEESSVEVLETKGNYGNGTTYGTYYPIVNKNWDGEKTLGELGIIVNNIPDYERLRLRSLDAYVKSDTIKIIAKKKFDWVVGSGLKLQCEPNITVLESEGIIFDNAKFQKLVEARFMVYANSKNCDHSKMQNLHQIAYEAYKGKYLAGDFLCIARFNDFGPTIQIIAAEHIKTPMIGNKLLEEAKARGNYVEHGIEFNDKGEHVSYFVCTKSEKSYLGDFERIEAIGINSGRKLAWLVYGEKISSDHKRSVPEISQILEKANKLDRYTEAAVGKAEQAAKILNAITHQDYSTGENPLDDLVKRKLKVKGDGAEVDNYVFEVREFPTSSGRFITSSGGFVWGSRPISGNVITSRLLLPAREKDNFYTVEYNKYLNNSITEYYNELLDERLLYLQGTDYTVSPSSVILTAASNMGSGSIIYVQRDLDSYIRIKEPSFISDAVKEKPWQFQVACGEFVHSSGIFGGNINYLVKNEYSVTNPVAPKELPKILNKHVLKVNLTPVYFSGSGYPDYNINDTIISGTINGRNIVDKVSSIDYQNGFIYITDEMNPMDNVVLDYTYDDRKTILVNSVDLNPKNTVSGSVDIALDSIGLALVPSGTVFYDSLSAPTDWSYLAYYRLSDNLEGNFDSGTTKGYAVEAVTEEVLAGPVSGIIPSGSKFMGFFSLNSIPKDMVKLYDARRLGGYDATDIKLHASGWRGFNDIGFWDGEAFPSAGTILIQIPSGVYQNIYNVFKSENTYTVTSGLYTPDLARVIERDISAYDSIEQQIDKATKKYIRDTIERYMPAGFLYIVVDETFTPWKSIRGDT